MRDHTKRPSRTRPAGGTVRPIPPKSPPRPAAQPPAVLTDKAKTLRVPAVTEALVAQKFSGFGEINWDWAKIQAFTLERINDVIASRSVPPESLVAPRLDIAIPAIEAMRYSPLKDEMAVLIASTMDARLAHEAHPAFIEVIKQLTADEVRILAALPNEDQVLPMASVTYIDRTDRVFASIRHVIPERIAKTCSVRRAIPTYVGNLLRQNLVATPANLSIQDERHYRDLLNQPFVSEVAERMPKHLKAEVERRVLALTDFGAAFRRCCLDPSLLPG